MVASNAIIDTPLYEAGADRGDEILRIGRFKIDSERDVERALGSRQFLQFYFLCGVLGVLVNFVPILLAGAGLGFFQGNMNISVVGASGATLGVLVAFAVLEPERQVFLFPIPVPIYAWMLVAIFVFLNLLTSLQPGSNMSVATHLGGMVTGYLYMKYRPKILAWNLKRRKPRQRGPSDDDMEKLGEEIDNIFRFQDRDRH